MTAATHTESEWVALKDRVATDLHYPPELWELIENFAVSLLEKGRPNFDVPHTRGVVAWMYHLLVEACAGQKDESGELDPIVLITAAWLHDVGYYGQFTDIERASFAQVQDKKLVHMLEGSWMAREFLEETASSLLSADQIDAIVHLVRVHDLLEMLSDADEQTLAMADTLGMLDVQWVEPTFTGNEALNFLTNSRTRLRFALFSSAWERKVLNEVLTRFEKFVRQRDFADQT